MKLVSAEEYLAELNRRLRAHPDYVPGMRFVCQIRSNLTCRVSGFDWEPKGYLHPFLEVSTCVRKEFSYPSVESEVLVPRTTRTLAQVAEPHG